MKISEYKGEEGLELIADIMIPMIDILSDSELQKYANGGVSNVILVQKILKLHTKEVLDIMARIDQEDRETYNPSVFELPVKLVEIFSQPEIKKLFTSQGRKKDGEPSGPATENIKVREEK